MIRLSSPLRLARLHASTRLSGPESGGRWSRGGNEPRIPGAIEGTDGIGRVFVGLDARGTPPRGPLSEAVTELTPRFQPHWRFRAPAPRVSIHLDPGSIPAIFVCMTNQI
jgi:hypothetical protein